MARRETTHYVNNAEFCAALTSYRNDVIVAKEHDLEIPPIPDFIGECLLKIANGLAQKVSFAGYTYKEEMIGDAIENCLLYLHNFNPEKSNNPFAYFTQIVYFAFIRRIGKEQRHSYTKYKYALTQSHLHKDILTPDGINSPASVWAGYDNIQEFVKNYEAKLLLRRSRTDVPDVDFDSDVVVNETEEKEPDALS